MLSKLTFNAGPDESSPSLSFEPGPVTIFIGPNNSGKSQALRDLELMAIGDHQSMTVVSSIALRQPSSSEEFLDCFRLIAHSDDGDEIRYMSTIPRMQEQILNVATSDANYSNQHFASSLLGRAFTKRLDGSTRLGLLNGTVLGDLQQPPQDHLNALFQNDNARKTLSSMVYAAFGQYLVLDPTFPGQVRVRLSEREPENSSEEQGLNKQARSFHQAAIPIESWSDGVKAYCGLLASILSSHYRLMLIDEPEAFLHPSLSRKLGHQLALLAKTRTANIMVATHSAEFLMGCIESGTPVQIVRMTYNKKVGTARLLATEELRTLMMNPLLRSANVLSGLFHDGVVVGEGDTDRAFYQEINYRLLASDDGGSPNTLFLNAQNKSTIRQLIGPLRRLGVPAAAVVDIDVIKEGGKNWTSLLTAAQVPKPLQEGWNSIRRAIKKSLEDTGKDMKRDGGIGLLSDDDLSTANELLDNLAKYGVFVVRNGEVEHWLAHLNVTGHGPPWLIPMFEAMGTEPTNSDYLQPASDDVWAFMREIAIWIADPKRKGVR